jgi:hypothetical protein
MARFIVGVDLGTTNCAVAYMDTEAEDANVEMFSIAQVVGPGEVSAQSTLPSFLLLPTEHEVAPEALVLPWDSAPDGAVGVFARDRGSELPYRVVTSAKSWLSYTGVDRTATILPWRGGDEDDDSNATRVSPVQASMRYLSHIRSAWNAAMDAPLENQDVFLTVPASFDPGARELTVNAAREAGLPNITLVEEPQAAFYSWLGHVGETWRKALRPGDVVLVCDVGGGTTDFSLIAVTDDGEGNLQLERVAVGNHILVGGDNMDLALAHLLTQRLEEKGKKVKKRQHRALIHACRRAKETLLAHDAPDDVPISVLGAGSKVIGGTLRTELTRTDVETLVLDGFFPVVGADTQPKRQQAIGLKKRGLAYESDPAITSHLAAFTARHGRAPTAVLWNGGVMKGAMIRERVLGQLGAWYGADSVRSLVGTDLDLAVGHGAAYYGCVRRGQGVRIRGGTARAYYIGVETAMPAIPGFTPPIQALCVAPFGMEEGTAVDLDDDELSLIVGQSATFRFFASTERKDPAGAIIAIAELEELAPIETLLPAADGHLEGEAVPVTLRAHVTEIGTLELHCVGNTDQWKLEYSVRES